MNYRVNIPRMHYSGADKRKREKARQDAELCALIETELRRRYDEIEPGEMQSIMSYDVADTIGRDPEQVRRIIFRFQGGSNGVTFGKEPLPGDTWNHSGPPVPETKPPSSDTTPDGKYSLRQRVDHVKFGAGTIVHIQGERLEIDFDATGSKRVVQSFVLPSRDT